MHLEGLTKRYGDVIAVAGIDLQIGAGELFSLLGPSGSGKTTALPAVVAGSIFTFSLTMGDFITPSLVSST